VGASICLKALTGRHLHTWHGLIGYCLKDEGLPHFPVARQEHHNYDMDLGREEYEKLGAGGPLKGKTQLTPHNVVQKAINYWQFHYKGNKNEPPSRVLRPCCVWEVLPHPQRGSSHMGAKASHTRAWKALWSILINPSPDIRGSSARSLLLHWWLALTQTVLSGSPSSSLNHPTMRSPFSFTYAHLDPQSLYQGLGFLAGALVLVPVLTLTSGFAGDCPDPS
jgi:hypothetical protein